MTQLIICNSRRKCWNFKEKDTGIAKTQTVVTKKMPVIPVFAVFCGIPESNKLEMPVYINGNWHDKIEGCHSALIEY
jgi:hypothetical protein